ncbi:hypothetical protein [Amycolatopsis anabasis]|uniref:hypothetical protein n=1 Tax=Amycolatopsis anabasis TaxID=1840409 RepID=UPI00131C73D2|nr:hypothetical protein [Amycolatopsis anabasis]
MTEFDYVWLVLAIVGVAVVNAVLVQLMLWWATREDREQAAFSAQLEVKLAASRERIEASELSIQRDQWPPPMDHDPYL